MAEQGRHDTVVLSSGSTPSEGGMTPEEELLWAEYDNSGRNVELRNHLVERYSYVVKRVAMKVVGNYQYFTYLDDIVSEGLIALLSAVEKFDRHKGVKFETYASIRLRGAMIDYIRKQDCFPRRVKVMARQINDADAALSGSLGRTPLKTELAEYLNVSADRLDRMLQETYTLNMLSFEQLLEERSGADEDFDTADNTNSPEQCLSEKELTSLLESSIEHLSEKEQLVIALYYKEQLKIKEIAEILEVSDSRVSQIHSNALRKLRLALEDY